MLKCSYPQQQCIASAGSDEDARGRAAMRYGHPSRRTWRWPGSDRDRSDSADNDIRDLAEDGDLRPLQIAGTAAGLFRQKLPQGRPPSPHASSGMAFS